MESLPRIKLPHIDLTNTDNVSSDNTDSDSSSSTSDGLSGKSDFVLPSSPSLEDFTIPELGSDHCIPNFKLGESPSLYCGAPITTQQALYTLVAWFASNPGLSKTGFGQLLNILHSFILPKDNNLPSSYADAIKEMQPFLSPVKDYHCCVNDCVVYRECHDGDYTHLSECPRCNEDRYKEGTTIPRKRFKYLPLETRVRRLFSDQVTSKLLQSHCHTESSDRVTSIHQSEAWKSWYSSEGLFQGENRALSFAICMDGLNPFSHERSAYSTCPIFLVILNLPHHIRMLSASAMLTGLIAGPNEPKNTNAYVDVLIDDILHLNTLKIYDGYKDEMFSLKANIVVNIFDYPSFFKYYVECMLKLFTYISSIHRIMAKIHTVSKCCLKCMLKLSTYISYIDIVFKYYVKFFLQHWHIFTYFSNTIDNFLKYD